MREKMMLVRLDLELFLSLYATITVMITLTNAETGSQSIAVLDRCSVLIEDGKLEKLRNFVKEQVDWARSGGIPIAQDPTLRDWLGGTPHVGSKVHYVVDGQQRLGTVLMVTDTSVVVNDTASENTYFVPAERVFKI
jgi:hypothetical protein